MTGVAPEALVAGLRLPLAGTFDFSGGMDADSFVAAIHYGASVFVTAPSNQGGGDPIGITTTDLYGIAGSNNGNPNDAGGLVSNNNASFGGTSAAAPQVAGALALVKEVHPELDTRLAKHLLVNSSLPVDLKDDSPEGGWTFNQAGCGFNPNYGFGLLNAGTLVKLADKGLTVSPPAQWNGPVSDGILPQLPPFYWPIEPSGAIGTPIPDNGELAYSIKVDDCILGVLGCATITGANDPLDALEEVGVTLDIEHIRRGDIEVILISPSGTSSRLVQSYTQHEEEAFDYQPELDDPPLLTGELHHYERIQHTFWSNAFWGEWPEGEWTLLIHDKVKGKIGKLKDYILHLRMGSVSAPVDFEVCALHRKLLERERGSIVFP